MKLFNQHQPDRIADVWSSDPSAQFLRSLLDDQADLLLKGRAGVDVGSRGGKEPRHWQRGRRAC
jgi:hypothetical protein